jgi:hypothetical protein
VPYGPADGATVPELSEEGLILHGGGSILSEVSGVGMLCRMSATPHAGGPKAENLGGAGAEPLPSHPPAQPSACLRMGWWLADKKGMRALSIRQPYAELILRGIKPIEFRSR